ncbi:MAG TPA: hypothetical protein P5317_11635 [Myxococcota bacterium]|nr:hypothetical protein [Myxococcota bacterium]HRV18645.1 hypothetical protein [Myxococcota bacterium]
MPRRTLFIISFTIALLCQLFLWPFMDGVRGAGTIPPGQALYLPTVKSSCFNAASKYVCAPNVFALQPTDVISPTLAASHTGFDTYINPDTKTQTPVSYAYVTVTSTVVYEAQAFVFNGAITETHAAYIEFLAGPERKDIDLGPGFADEYSTAITAHGAITESAVLFRVENTLTSLVVKGTDTPCGLSCMASIIRRRIR